jgi:hypothetical protein
LLLLAIVFAAWASLFSTPARGAVTVGDLSDWGVSLNANKQLVFSGGIVNNATNPGNHGVINNFLGSGQRLYYHAEDSSDTAKDGGFVGPYYGGQNYDGEFMGVIIDGQKLQIAISTGQRPDNGLERFSPGDIRISTNQGVIGVEVGGGAGNLASTDGEINKGGSGTTYALNSGGYTVSASSAGGAAGSVWLANAPNNADWITDAIAHSVPVELNYAALSASQKLGDASDYNYNYSEALDQHAFITLTLDFSALGGLNLNTLALNSVFWSPSCDNDELYVDLAGAQFSHLGPGEALNNPEPASLLVWSGLGALALVAHLRRRGAKDSRLVLSEAAPVAGCARVS